MKAYLIIILFAAQLSLKAQTLNHLVVGEDSVTKLLGPGNREGLMQEPFQQWFSPNHQQYQVDSLLLAKINSEEVEDLSIEIFMGTWCGDSKREVPRFYKILDHIDYPESRLKLTHLDRLPETYKQSPSGEEKGKFIHRVPTFIFYRDNKEIGRIVESPRTSLEMDLVQILKGLPSEPNYRVVHKIDPLLDQQPLDSLENWDILLSIAREIQHDIWSSSELNTYGYYLMGQKKLDKAIAAFRINSIFFRYNPNVYDSLGEAYEKKQLYEQALSVYQRCLDLEPKHENAIARVAEIEEMLDKQGK